MSEMELFVRFVRFLKSQGFVPWRLAVNGRSTYGCLALPAEGKRWSGRDDRIRVEWEPRESEPWCLDLLVNRGGLRSDTENWVWSVQQAIDVFAAVTGIGHEYTSGYLLATGQGPDGDGS